MAGTACKNRKNLRLIYRPFLPKNETVFERYAFGREKAINLELLTSSILTYWKPAQLTLKNYVLNEINKSRGRTDLGFLYEY